MIVRSEPDARSRTSAMPALAVAHRGDPRGHRENTIPAVLSALEQGADLVEVDLASTADGHVVLLHDPTLKRLWNVDASVHTMTLADVRRLGAGPLAIPTFDQAMAVLSGAGAHLMADLKDVTAARESLKITQALGALSRLLFVGEANALRAVRADCAEAHIGLSWSQKQRPDSTLINELGAEFINLHWPLIDQDVVDWVHAQDRKVSTWTVDSPSNMARLLDLGVDAVVTNRLRYLLGLLKARRARELGDLAC